MTRKYRYLQRLAVVAVLGAAECAALGAALIGPAQAQDFPFLTRQRAPRGGDGFFQQLFGGSNRRQDDREYQQQQAPADNSRAPAARKVDPKVEQAAPTTSVVVLGDGMADWLAYGLEDAFADTPEVGIVRKNKTHSGLIRYDARSDLDWWHAARDLLAPEKPNYVIMMLGVADRQNMREKDVAKEAEKKDADKKADAKDANKDAANKDAANKDTANKDAAGKDKPAADQNATTKEPDDDELPSIAAPEPAAGRKAGGNLEFRGDAWEKIYTRRIDETVAALKSKGVPVFWVGLPSIRGTKSTADAVYLNDLYRARAEKAGAVYIDVWDGFVDEAGKYTNFGPDYEGQMRRLRSGDGVYFTKYGARKLAHYVERELRRYMSNRGPMALPSGPMGPVPADGKPAARPLAGPVVPLTLTSGNSDELLGGPSAAAARADATAAGVLVKGDAVAAPSGRADDFWWPRGSAPPPTAAPPVASAPPAAASASVTPPTAPASAPAVAVPALVAKPEAKPEPKPEPKPAAKPEPKPEPKPRAAEVRPPPRQPQAADPRAPRPPQTVQQQPRRRDDGGLFGIFR